MAPGFCPEHPLMQIALAVTLLSCGSSFVTSEETGAGGAGGSGRGGSGAGASGAGGGGAEGATMSSTNSGPGSGGGGAGEGGGGGGGQDCFTCLQAFSQATSVPVGAVCDGPERAAFVALSACICGETDRMCGTCAAFCASEGGTPGSCLTCVDDLDVCDDAGQACAIPFFE